MSLELLPNRDKPKLPGAGSVSLFLGKVTVNLDPHSVAYLLRDGNLVKLLESTDSAQSTSGPAKVGDVYTLGTGDEKLVVRVSEKQAGQISLKPQDLTSATPQGKKTTLTVGLILLALLFFSVIFGLKQKSQNDLEKTYGVKLEQAISHYQESLSLFELDRSKSRELFLSAQELLKEVETSKYENPKILELSKNLSEKQGEILGEYKASLSEFLDLTLQTSGFDGQSLVSSGTEIFILDSEKKKIIQVNLESKSARLAADIQEGSTVKNMASYEDRLFVERDDGVYEVSKNGFDKAFDKDWDEGFLYFYSANAYFLDKPENKIYRFPGDGSAFGQKSDWLAPGIETDFSRVVDMTIDGSIWLLSNSGRVSKFVLGSPQSITLDGLPGDFSNPLAIYTNEELEHVYILDQENSRVVVLDKSGDFVVQYVSDELENAKDLVVSEEEKKVILLNGSKLMQIELN